ncbi:Uncharacterized protein GBIM_00636 [Gryllus bimaculatus]|nr:Uncharacterized protein GBIM_00636 [Gryllus bimaculatus]
MFVLFLNFRGQRFWTQPVTCKSHPNFDAGFLYELHDDDLDETQMARASHLLNINEKIHIVLVRILPSGEKVLVSSHHFEWRQILFAQESLGTFSIDLLGVGAESNIVVGVIDVRITLIPKLLQPLTEKTVLSRIRFQNRNQEEQDRIFLLYAKTWWKEYLSLRPEHSRRTVKLFHQDENGQNRPVFHFVQCLKVGRPLLELPQEAAWFVSLIHLQPPSLMGALPVVEQWYIPHTFLCIKKGGPANHATLLCSLFLGFGLDAYVCIGTKDGNIPWEWVVTISKDNYAPFWESTTGSRYGHDPQLPTDPYKYLYPYKTIGCLFNHKSFYANIQESDKVKLCIFNVANKRLWKNLSEAAISSVVQNLNLFLMPGWTEPFIYSQEMETELRARITEYRQNIGVSTRWDIDLCHIIAPVLALYEMEHRMGLVLRKEEIDDLISKNIPDGFSFRALPMRVSLVDKKQVLGVCLRNAVMESIVTCSEMGCKLALRVHTYVYPENILSIWLIVANKFRSE